MKKNIIYVAITVISIMLVVIFHKDKKPYENKDLMYMTAYERFELFKDNGLYLDTKEIQKEINGENPVKFFEDEYFEAGVFDGKYFSDYPDKVNLLGEIRRIYVRLDDKYKVVFKNARY